MVHHLVVVMVYHMVSLVMKPVHHMVLLAFIHNNNMGLRILDMLINIKVFLMVKVNLLVVLEVSQ
jgi:hypothetical protein